MPDRISILIWLAAWALAAWRALQCAAAVAAVMVVHTLLACGAVSASAAVERHLVALCSIWGSDEQRRGVHICITSGLNARVVMAHYYGPTWLYGTYLFRYVYAPQWDDAAATAAACSGAVTCNSSGSSDDLLQFMTVTPMRPRLADHLYRLEAGSAFAVGEPFSELDLPKLVL